MKAYAVVNGSHDEYHPYFGPEKLCYKGRRQNSNIGLEARVLVEINTDGKSHCTFFHLDKLLQFDNGVPGDFKWCMSYSLICWVEAK